jgi:hypothetical protein
MEKSQDKSLLPSIHAVGLVIIKANKIRTKIPDLQKLPRIRKKD